MSRNGLKVWWGEQFILEMRNKWALVHPVVNNFDTALTTISILLFMKRVSLKTPRQIITNYLVILQFLPKQEQNRSKSSDIFLPWFEKYSACSALQKMQILSYQAEPDGEKREEKKSV